MMHHRPPTPHPPPHHLPRHPHLALPHASASTPQWAFVNFKRLQDAEAAYAALRFRVVRQLSGDLFLKLQYRPV